MLRAKDVMRKKVITIDGYQTAQELADLLRERCISGVPVLDEGGKVVGVVSTTDLLRTKRDEADVPSYHLWPDGRGLAVPAPIEADAEARVDTIMTAGAIAFPEDAPVEEIAKAMLDLHIHRVLVTKNGKLCGIISSLDMLKALLPKRSIHRAGR